MTPRAAHLVPRSPGRRKRWLSESFGFMRSQGRAFRRTGEMGVGVSESCESQVQTKLVLNKDQSTQLDLEDSKSSGSAFPPNSGMSSQAGNSFGNVSAYSQTVKIQEKEMGIQAFEDEPWEGLLSRQEVCDMIKNVQIHRFRQERECGSGL